jgi:cytochrome c oxidase subunit 3
MGEAHASEHHEHVAVLTFWPLVIGLGALFLPFSFMSAFQWKIGTMTSLIIAGIGIVSILVGGFGWAQEIYSQKHEFLNQGFGTAAISFFIISEALLFGGLFSGYFYNMIPAAQWPPMVPNPTPEGVPPLSTALFLSIFLLSSSGTIHIAEEKLENDDISGFSTWLIVTMVLGLLFLSGQAYEWTHLFSENFTISTNAYGTFFFMITGFHGSHVVVGLIMQLFVLLLAFGGRVKHGKGKDTLVKATGYYWHFVDGIWLLVLSLIYILPTAY